jgi:iron(III) transport system permease protein
MTTVAVVVFLYSPATLPAAVAILNLEDAGLIAPAAAIGMMIFYTNAGVRLLHGLLSQQIDARWQRWRSQQGA